MRPVIKFNTGGGNYWTVLCIVFSFWRSCVMWAEGGVFFPLYISIL
jgi:hypothetical protein